MPRWLQARPFLLATALTYGNINRRHRALLPVIVALLVIGAGLLTVPTVGVALEVIAQYPVSPFVLLAASCAVSTARRKTRVYRSVVDSWLAPLSAPPSIGLRLAFVPVLQAVLLSIAVAIPVLVGNLRLASAVTLWEIVWAAYAAGGFVGWLTPHSKALGAPDFHYVTIRKPRANWAQAPQLEPLSYWAIGQTRVATKPKVTAGALLFVLMALPSATGGEKAIAIGAGAWVVLYLTLLAVSAIRVAFTAARWLAPTTMRYRPFTITVGYRVLLAQLWTCGWVIFLTSAAGLYVVLHLALTVTAVCLLLTCVAIPVACRMAMKAANL